jgi:hypothetical protein
MEENKEKRSDNGGVGEEKHKWRFRIRRIEGKKNVIEERGE